VIEIPRISITFSQKDLDTLRKRTNHHRSAPPVLRTQYTKPIQDIRDRIHRRHTLVLRRKVLLFCQRFDRLARNHKCSIKRASNHVPAVDSFEKKQTFYTWF
jgi:hypothetical protein